MKYVDEFRDPAAAAALRERIAESAASDRLRGRRISIMEVCGTHTMAIARNAIRDILPDNIELISGPGCPVCVTDPGYLDTAIDLARRECIIATFGDMVHVPGSNARLADARAEDADIQVCYSPDAALGVCTERPDREIVFLAVGFETTIAPVVSILDKAARDRIGNLSLLTAFKRIPPALDALVADPELNLDALLCPPHVSAVIGSGVYEPIARNAGIPCVIAGFEPLDILSGIDAVLAQLRRGEARVENLYSRVVRRDGNPKARAIIDKYLRPVTSPWRGLGDVPNGALALRMEYRTFDAETRHGVSIGPGRPDPRCLCGEVIKGKARPEDCGLFSGRCAPDHPVGPCMVSREGICAAHFLYPRGTS